MECRERTILPSGADVGESICTDLLQALTFALEGELFLQLMENGNGNGKLPYCPFYWKDFWNDPKVMAMTYEEVGIYCRLLAIAWEQKGVIDCDDAVIAKSCNLTLKRWKKHKEAVMAAFYFGEDGKWHQRRTEREYQKTQDRHVARVEAGRKGGAKFALGLLEQCSSKVQSNAQARANAYRSDPFPLSPEGEPEREPATVVFTPPRWGRAHRYEDLRLYVLQHFPKLTENDAAWAWEHFEGNGWTNNGVPMTDWRKVLASWERKKICFPSIEKEKKR